MLLFNQTVLRTLSHDALRVSGEVLQATEECLKTLLFRPTDVEIALFVCYSMVLAFISYMAVRDIRRANSERQDMLDYIHTLRRENRQNQDWCRNIQREIRERQQADLKERQALKESVIDNLLPIINTLHHNNPVRVALIEVARKYQFGNLRLEIVEDCEACECVGCHESSSDSGSSSDGDHSSDSDYVPPRTKRRRG